MHLPLQVAKKVKEYSDQSTIQIRFDEEIQEVLSVRWTVCYDPTDQ